jgi:hypothetical protein
LEHSHQPIPKVHDLNYLLHLVLPLEPLWAGLVNGMKELTDYAVTSRYPGMQADAKAATRAFTICKEARELARHGLQLR